MVTYHLVSKSENNNKKVMLKRHKLSELDNFIYNNFKSEIELSNYFEIAEGKFYITYTYQNNPKISDLILKDENRDFSYLLHNTSKNNIDTNSKSFRNIIAQFLNNTSVSEIKYLFENNYIDKYTYNNLMEMKNCSKGGLDYARDMSELFSYIKQDLKRYISFRKFYSGIIAYNNHETKIVNAEEPLIAKTSNDYVNDAFNNGGYDELYSYFDLDDLYKIDGIEELGIARKK